MKKIIGIIALLFTANTVVNAQATPKSTNEETKPSRDFFMLQLSHDGWDQSTTDVATKFNRGFGAYLNYDFPLGKKELTNVSFAIGIGVSASNIYLDDKQLVDLKTDNEATSFILADSNTKGHKFASSYLEAPLEFRFYGNKYNRNRGFKAAVGVKIGYNIGATSKYKMSTETHWVTEKEKSTRFMNQWKFAPTVRIGWGNISVFGSYNVTTLFKEGRGPEINPYQIGICISGL